MRYQQGQTLIEVVVALAAAVVVVASITGAVITALSNAEYGKNQSLATTYAQQALEVMRGVRDADYTSFNSYTNTYCFAKECTQIVTQGQQQVTCGPQGSTGCGHNIDGIFSRSITFNQNASDCQGSGTKVTVTVAWNDGKCNNPNNLDCHNVTVATCLTNYNSIPTP